MMISLLAFGLGATARAADPLALPPATQAELDKQLAGTWTKIVPELDAALLKAVAAQSGTQHGALTISSLSVPNHDFSAAPRLSMVPSAARGAHGAHGEHVEVDLPGPGRGWFVELKGHVEYVLQVKVWFVKITKHFSEDVTIDVRAIHASEGFDLDTTDPTLPVCTKTGNVQLDYKLNVHTSSALLNVVLFFAKPFIDKLLRDQVDKALQALDLRITPLAGLPNKTPWGANGPARAPFAQQPDLEKAALALEADIQKWHVPYNQLLSAYFDDPTYGKGNVTEYTHIQDSAIWTGHYLAAECFRWAVTKDPAAQDNAARLLSGIEDLLDAETPGGGHLVRCTLPLTAPGAKAMLGYPDFFATTLHGQPYVANEHISRDQYLGVMLGLGCAHDFLDDPASKQRAGDLAGRIVDYLVANDWVAMAHDNKTPVAPFVQSTDKMVMFTAIAAHANPRFQRVRDEIAPLVSLEWLSEWIGLLDPLDGYFGWNLGNGTRYHAMRLETDPARFMALERAHEIERRGIGHHENAWFQCVDAAVEPALAPQVAPEILDELRRWVARSRRMFSTQLSTDPSIPHATYTAPFGVQKGPGGASLVAVARLEATYPIAVERRCGSEYLWQEDPFQLDNPGDPHEQHPGEDLVLPYWMGRFYNLVR
jgi:hypothetical protein